MADIKSLRESGRVGRRIAKILTPMVVQYSLMYHAYCDSKPQFLFEALEDGADIDYCGFESEAYCTALQMAVEAEMPGRVRFLLDHGASVDAGNPNRGILCPCVIDPNQSLNAKRMLPMLLAGKGAAKVLDRRFDEMTALMRACSNRHEESAMLLIHAGADISLRDKHGRTALNLARIKQSPKLSSLLLWQAERVLWLGIEDENSLIFKLPLDVVRVIVHDVCKPSVLDTDHDGTLYPPPDFAAVIM